MIPKQLSEEEYQRLEKDVGWELAQHEKEINREKALQLKVYFRDVDIIA